MAFGDIVQGPYSAAHGSHPQITLGVSPTVGNLIVVLQSEVAGESLGDSPLATAITYEQTNSVDDVSIFYRVVQGGDGTTWGCTSGNNSVIIAWEVEGPFDAAPFDVSAGNQGDVDPATQSTGTTAATAQASEYAVGAITWRNVAGTASGWTNGFTEVGEGVGSFAALYGAYKVLSSTGTVETTATLSGTPVGDRAWGCIATFKAASGGGGGGSSLRSPGKVYPSGRTPMAIRPSISNRIVIS